MLSSMHNNIVFGKIVSFRCTALWSGQESGASCFPTQNKSVFQTRVHHASTSHRGTLWPTSRDVKGGAEKLFLVELMFAVAGLNQTPHNSFPRRLSWSEHLFLRRKKHRNIWSHFFYTKVKHASHDILFKPSEKVEKVNRLQKTKSQTSLVHLYYLRTCRNKFAVKVLPTQYTWQNNSECNSILTQKK